ncbi:Tetratricopeptide repeat-domain-containing protein [Paraphoma chrysanthemicola]|uniref:Tetratricopeptide repeat-domain-containing protein n=1 Tax=Paraphoma chrysanthemicola TaxID=798071 RepID=A0A8K0QTY2_9PLEO|nr:Tetratricopeptide repeat-domain-containing protein [Paraphoma chrysanthemicola]
MGVEEPPTMNFLPLQEPNPATGNALQPGTSLASRHLLSIQRAQRLHAAGDTSTLVRHAQYGGSQASDSRSYAQRPSTVYDASSNGGGQSASAFGSAPALTVAASAGSLLPMGPPLQSRKRKAPTLREADWEPYKDRILYLLTIEELSVPEVKLILEEEEGFKAELRQYRSRISQWGKDKNVKTHEMQAIVRKRQKRRLVETDKGQLAFDVRGKLVESQKIERWMKRNSILESVLYAPSPAAPTPSDVGCCTISDRGSPAMTSFSSPAAWAASPRMVQAVAQIPSMSSPALSTVSTSIQPLTSTFTVQSPALVHRSLAKPRINFDLTSSTTGAQMELDVVAQPRYNQDEEERLLDQILQLETSPESNAEERAHMLRELARVLIDQGRYRAAEEVARRLTQSYESLLGIDEGGEEEEAITAIEILGITLFHQGLYQKAESMYRRVLRARERLLGHEHDDTLFSVKSLGLLLFRDMQYDEAEAILRRALEGGEKVLGKEHPDTLDTLCCLGMVLKDHGRHEKAEKILQKALEGYRKVHGKSHPYTLDVTQELATLFD